MRRILLFIVLLTNSFISFAQSHPLETAMERVLYLFEQEDFEQAYHFWCDSSEKEKTDSLYVWANVAIAQGFINFGHLSEAEMLINKAEQALEGLKSNSFWYWEQVGYLSTKKATLYCLMHDYNLAHLYACDAKIAFEHISFRGLDYARALSVLSQTTLRQKGHQVLARTFASHALSIAFLVYNQTQSDSDFSSFAQLLRECCAIELSLGSPNKTLDVLEQLSELNRQRNYEDHYVDLYLGNAYVRNGDYDKAIDCLTSVYEDCEELPQRITSGLHLLYAKYKLGHSDLFQLACDLARLQVGQTSQMFSFMSDREKEKWWMSNENGVISFADEVLLRSNDPGVNSIIADNEIFSKGILLRSSNMLRNAALGSQNEEIVNSYRTLEALKYKLSVTSGESEQSILESEISALEKDLLRKLNISIDDIPSWKAVASSLSREEVALEFVRFDTLGEADSADYYVIIVKKGAKEPIIRHLFDESALKQLLDNRTNKRIDRYVFELYTTEGPNCKGNQLYDLIWSKLEKEIKGYRTIYYSPAGILNSISLQALSKGKQSLGEKYVMHLVSSIGTIPHIKNAKKDAGNYAVIYGGVQYDAEETELREASRSYLRRDSDYWEPELNVTRSGWAHLPGTETEAQDISSLMSQYGYTAKMISGIDANEESFKALSGTQINTIHIATHGFYLSEQKEINKNAFLNPMMADNIGKVDPMLRSGLLFAGANRVWTGKRSIEGIEDGILTAKEISNLNLSNVELVVLSACQTGLGTVEANEGVYGLQRAFKLAGAETLIMSLWEVDDQATSILMRTFYEEYLNGKSKDIAFKDAVTKVRDYTDRDGDRPYASPYYWAAFIMLD